MKLLKNQASERVIDELRASLTAGGSLDVASPDLSLFAYGELQEALRRLSSCRLILPFAHATAQSLLGSDLDRGYRNQLSAHQLARHFAAWFTQLWGALPATADGKEALLAQLSELTARREPSLIYALTLYHLFKDRGDELDEDKIVKSATGIRNTVVWKKLYKFQRDGVVGAIAKLERLGGCIIAHSVGLGKTFEALTAILQQHGLENVRSL